MRKYEFENTKLAKILEERAEIFKAIGKINEQLMDLDKERKKLGYKMDKLKERTRPFIDAVTKDLNLTEFEVITQVGLNKYQRPEIEIVDRLEEYANAIREEAKDKK